MNINYYTGIQSLENSFSPNIAFLQNSTPYGLVQSSDGSLSMNPKPPAFVVGEQVLGPLIGRFTSVFSTLWSYAQAVDSVFTRVVTIPGAAAQPQVDAIIRELDIKSLDEGTFKSMFISEWRSDWMNEMRVQLLNEEQVKAAYEKFPHLTSRFEKYLSSDQIKRYQAFLKKESQSKQEGRQENSHTSFESDKSSAYKQAVNEAGCHTSNDANCYTDEDVNFSTSDIIERINKIPNVNPQHLDHALRILFPEKTENEVRNIGQAAVRKVHRKIMLTIHPDKVEGTAAEAVIVNVALDTLMTHLF